MSEVESFDALGLSPAALAALSGVGFTKPTPIQARAIPPAMQGLDVIGCAATGTGKSAAFALPILERLTGKQGTRALVLAPTRELAEQTAQQFAIFGRSRGMFAATIIGGSSMDAQNRVLARRPPVVIATPGRLVDHLQRGSAQLGMIEILVLDEADRMLDMGFRPQLEKIIQRLPAERQTLLFSATLGPEVAKFVKTAKLKNPVRVEVARSGATADRIEQVVYMVGQGDKIPTLMTLLAEDQLSTLVFTRTKHRADKVAKVLLAAGHATARIHANRTQAQRRQALEGFRAGQYRVLIATDIAARGIDVVNIGHVVNFDLPHVPEDYVHRIGRTARASASGSASSLVAPEERPLLADIERYIRQALPRKQIDRNSEAFQREVRRAAAAPPPKPSMPQRGGGGRNFGRPGQGGRPSGGRPGGGGGGYRQSHAGQASGGEQRESGQREGTFGHSRGPQFHERRPDGGRPQGPGAPQRPASSGGGFRSAQQSDRRSAPSQSQGQGGGQRSSAPPAQPRAGGRPFGGGNRRPQSGSWRPKGPR